MTESRNRHLIAQSMVLFAKTQEENIPHLDAVEILKQSLHFLNKAENKDNEVGLTPEIIQSQIIDYTKKAALALFDSANDESTPAGTAVEHLRIAEKILYRADISITDIGKNHDDIKAIRLSIQNRESLELIHNNLSESGRAQNRGYDAFHFLDRAGRYIRGMNLPWEQFGTTENLFKKRRIFHLNIAALVVLSKLHRESTDENSEFDRTLKTLGEILQYKGILPAVRTKAEGEIPKLEKVYDMSLARSYYARALDPQCRADTAESYLTSAFRYAQGDVTHLDTTRAEFDHLLTDKTIGVAEELLEKKNEPGFENWDRQFFIYDVEDMLRKAWNRLKSVGVDPSEPGENAFAIRLRAVSDGLDTLRVTPKP